MAGRKVATVSPPGERGDVIVGQEGAMVGRRAAELDRQLHTGAMSELVGVQPQAEARPAARFEHGTGLVGVERATLAEGVDPTRMRRARGEHLAADQVDVIVRAALELGRHDVRAEEGGLVAQLASDAQRTRLVDDVEPVTGLDLDGRRARPAGLGAAATMPVTSSSASVAARVADIVVRIPPASYGRPDIRAANSSARSPANTRWLWLSTKPGSTQRPDGVDSLVGGRRRPGSHRIDQPVDHHHPGIVQLTGRADARTCVSLVISRPMLSTTVDVPAVTTTTAVIDRSSSQPATSII